MLKSYSTFNIFIFGRNDRNRKRRKLTRGRRSRCWRRLSRACSVCASGPRCPASVWWLCWRYLNADNQSQLRLSLHDHLTGCLIKTAGWKFLHHRTEMCLFYDETGELSSKHSKMKFTFTGFGFQRLEVKDGDAGGLTAGSCSRRNWSSKYKHMKRLWVLLCEEPWTHLYRCCKTLDSLDQD